MILEEDIKLDFKDVLIKPKRSTLESRSEVDLVREIQCPHSSVKISGVNIVAANMDGVGTFEIAKRLITHNAFTALSKHYSIDSIIDFFKSDENLLNYVFYSMGTSDSDFQKFQTFSNKFKSPKLLCLDVANGYTQSFIKRVSELRKALPESFIMVGNVVTPEITEELIIAGASCIKIGIGSGAVCLTRKLTGVGYPQLSAIIECSEAAHGLRGHICADGGCTVPGDVAKAFGGGSDFVMLGSMLSGSDEGGGELITIDSKQYIKFYGMSSKTAQDIHNGGLKEYRSSEGRTVLIEPKGKIDDIFKSILGGLRSACTYTGSQKLKDLPKRTVFVRVHNQLNTTLEKHTVGN